jgi:hypothetical protein
MIIIKTIIISVVIIMPKPFSTTHFIKILFYLAHTEGDIAYSVLWLDYKIMFTSRYFNLNF